MSIQPIYLDAAVEPAGEAVAETVTELVKPQTDFGNLLDLLSIPLVKGALTLVLCLAIAKIIMRVINQMLRRSKLEETMKKFIQNILRAIVYGIFLIIAASSFGFELTSLVAFASVVAAAFALAAQDVLSNFFGGILLMISKPFLVGEYIVTGAGEGTVQEVALLNTRLISPDNRLIIIPNGTLISGTVTNFNRTGSRRLELDFAVAYGADMEQVKAALLEVLEAQPATLHMPEAPEDPFARVTAYTEKSVTYSARIWCKTEDYWPTRFDILEQVKQTFDARGIQMAYTYLNVHVPSEEKKKA